MGLYVGLCSRTEIICWADCLIEQSEYPEDWTIDLSTSQGKHLMDVLHLLRAVPGIVNLDVSFRLLVAKLGRLHPTVSPEHTGLLANLYRLVDTDISDDLKAHIYEIDCDLDWLESGEGDWSVVQQDYEELLAIGNDYRSWVD